jgi:hypothetical protein
MSKKSLSFDALCDGFNWMKLGQKRQFIIIGHSGNTKTWQHGASKQGEKRFIELLH